MMMTTSVADDDVLTLARFLHEMYLARGHKNEAKKRPDGRKNKHKEVRALPPYHQAHETNSAGCWGRR